MDKFQALHQFWSSFSWKAYDQNTVPSEDLQPEMPRITYEAGTAGFEDIANLTASLWDKSYSWASVSAKAEEIFAYIGLGGAKVNFDGGQIWITRGSPFAQRMSDEDDSIRRIVLQVQVEYLTYL